mgnify:CR=1 FL=1|tara:strand:+ start:7061 stop:7774 length:714 start_codon:yes stop_codon:yes gene_type:complete
MSNIQLSIYKKYIQARYSFNIYTQEFVSKLSLLGASKGRAAVYNILSAWLDFIGNSVSEPYTVAAVSPAPIGISIETDSSYTYPLVSNIFITNLSGLRELVATATILGTGSVVSLENVHPQITAAYSPETNLIVFTFPKGDHYNGGRAMMTKVYLITSPVIRGGVSGDTNTSYLSSEDLNNIETLLDRIAIELGIVFSNRDYLLAVEASEGSEGERQALRSPNNKTLTTEDGRPLDV